MTSTPSQLLIAALRGLMRQIRRYKLLSGLLAWYVAYRLLMRRLSSAWHCRWPLVKNADNSRPDIFRASSVRQKKERRRGFKNFPPPYPNGWMFVCPSDRVGKKDVVPLKLWGRELVVFRGEDGEVGVLDAYCPHMGTHVGHGGYVKNCAVVCPYHEWEFDVKGKLVGIPKLQVDYEAFPRYEKNKGNQMRRFPTVETEGGMVFAWMHADEAEPFDLWIARRPKELGLQFACRTVVGDFHMHVMEPAHNSCDWYHFLTVHSTLGQHWQTGWPKLIQPEIWSPPARCKQLGSDDDDGTPIAAPDVLITDQRMKSLRLLGVKAPQALVDRLMNVQVRFSGPMLGSVSMTVPVFGTFYGIVTMTPDGPFETHVELWSFTDWKWPKAMAWAASQSIMRTINQDREVWEHRTHLPYRNAAKNDYKWTNFDKWLRQFYSESSFKWGDDEMLDW